MTVGSLFSGIGGFDLGLERAGMTVKWQVEIDPFCNKVLAKHWPNVRRYGDVKEVHGVSAHAVSSRSNGQEIHEGQRRSEQTEIELVGNTGRECAACLPPVDLLCGGPPCQPASVAGKRGGTADDRWLWPSALRLVRELRPAWCLFENPTGILSLEGGIPFESVLSDLEGQGYEVQSFVIPACAVGAPHRRDRVWIVAKSTSGGWESRRPERSGQVGTSTFDKSDSHAADAEDADRRRVETSSNNIRRGRQKAGGQVCSDWNEHWYDVALRTCVRGMDDGAFRRVDRLKSLGNAVVPQIVEILGRAIIESEMKVLIHQS